MSQITQPTRLSDICNTLIDNIFTNNYEKNNTNCILTRTIYDHQMTCYMLHNHNVTNPVNRHNIEVENINKFKKHFPNANLANHISTELDIIYVKFKHNNLSLNVKQINA